MRKMGDILLDMEKIIDEMVVTHELQKGDIIALVSAHIDIHHPGCIEEYVDGSPSPKLYYGP